MTKKGPSEKIKRTSKTREKQGKVPKEAPRRPTLPKRGKVKTRQTEVRKKVRKAAPEFFTLTGTLLGKEITVRLPAKEFQPFTPERVIEEIRRLLVSAAVEITQKKPGGTDFLITASENAQTAQTAVPEAVSAPTTEAVSAPTAGAVSAPTAGAVSAPIAETETVAATAMTAPDAEQTHPYRLELPTEIPALLPYLEGRLLELIIDISEWERNADILLLVNNPRKEAVQKILDRRTELVSYLSDLETKVNNLKTAQVQPEGKDKKKLEEIDSGVQKLTEKLLTSQGTQDKIEKLEAISKETETVRMAPFARVQGSKPTPRSKVDVTDVFKTAEDGAFAKLLRRLGITK